MDDKQYIFSICDLLNINVNDGGFSVGRWVDSEMKPKSDPEIVHWHLSNEKPTHDQIVSHWDKCKHRYKEPF